MHSILTRSTCASQSLARQTFICSIQIAGKESRNMYDEHPGDAFYHVDACRIAFVPPFCSLERAIDIGIRAFSVLQEQVDLGDEEGECDGDFSPREVVLRDGAGNVVFQFAGTRDSAEHQLVAPLAPPAEYDALRKQADILCDEAALESSWDNFDSANRLREQSAAIRARISRSRHFAAVAKAESMRGLEVRAAYSLVVALLRADPKPTPVLIKKMRAIRTGARRLGFFESLNGATSSPVMFADCPELHKAWLAGAQEWADASQSGFNHYPRDAHLLV